VSAVVTDGCVRRPAGPWTPAVHALLRHFERVGFRGAPRALGVEEGWELLEWVEGEVPGRDPTPVRDDAVFALGDCAACPQPGSDRPVPPRAQAAYQQAQTLAKNLSRRLQGKPPHPFVYKDHGSLVSLSYSSVGNLMGNLLGSVMIEGKLACLTYLSLYKKHQLALHGLV